MKTYILLKGNFKIRGKNSHNDNYKIDAYNSISKALDLINNEISGYESVLIILSSNKLTNS